MSRSGVAAPGQETVPGCTVAEEGGQRRGPLSMPGCGQSLDLGSPQSGQLALQGSDSKGPKRLIAH